MDRQYQELRNKYKTPFLVDKDPHNSNLVEPILQAADFTLEKLGVNTRSFDRFNYDDIIMELIELNGKSIRTYQRKSEFMDIPVLGITNVLYRLDGKEIISAYCFDDKMAMISRSERALENFLSKDSAPLPTPLLAGLVTIEEMVHFYQDVHLNRTFRKGNLYYFDNLAKHSKDPLEREAALFVNIIAPEYALIFHNHHNILRKVPEYFTNR